MSRRLLDRDLIDQLLQADDEQPVMDVLMESAYGADLSLALETQNGIPAAESALRRNLFETLRKVLKIAPAGPAKLIEIQLNRWDLANVLALVRGKIAGVPAGDQLSGMVPAGQYHPVQLRQLAEIESIPAMTDALTTWGYAYGFTLKKLLRDSDLSEGTSAFESRLYSQYYDWALSRLDRRDHQEKVFMDMLRMQADLQNIAAMLKRVDARMRKQAFEDVQILPHGKLGAAALHNLGDARDMDEALTVLDRSDFSSAVEKGVLSYGRSGRLGEFERFLEAVILERGARHFRGDPLSIAVPIGFIWRKVAEYQNIRMIIRGKKYHFPPNSIREALVLV